MTPHESPPSPLPMMTTFFIFQIGWPLPHIVAALIYQLLAHIRGLLARASDVGQLLLTDGRAHLYVDGAAVETVLAFGKYFSRAIETHGQNVEPELLRNVERALMKTPNLAVGRASALGKYGNAVSPLRQRAQLGHHFFHTVGHRIVFGVADNKAVEGIAPHPVVGEENDVGRENQHAHQVEVRLVVANHHVRFVESLRLCHFVAETCARNKRQRPSEERHALAKHHKSGKTVDDPARSCASPPFLRSPLGCCPTS